MTMTVARAVGYFTGFLEIEYLNTWRGENVNPRQMFGMLANCRLWGRITYFSPGDQMPLLTCFPFDISAIQVFSSAGLLGLASDYMLGQFKGNSLASHSFYQKALKMVTDDPWG